MNVPARTNRRHDARCLRFELAAAAVDPCRRRPGNCAPRLRGRDCPLWWQRHPPGQLTGLCSVRLAAGFLGSRAVRGPAPLRPPSAPSRNRRRIEAVLHAPEPQYPDVVLAAARRDSGRRGAGSAGRRDRPSLRGADGRHDLSSDPVLDRGVSIDIGDPFLSTWRLAWIAHQFPRDPLHLFDANIFYPELRTLAYSDAMLIPSLTVAPLVWLGMPSLLACNVLLLSGFALSGAGMFLLVWSLTRHVPAALLAGFVFAFLPYRYMHYAHLELQMAQWMPLVSGRCTGPSRADGCATGS